MMIFLIPAALWCRFSGERYVKSLRISWLRSDSVAIIIAAALVNHGNRKPGRQGAHDGGKIVGGGHQIDVLCSLGNELFKDLPQLPGIHGLSHRTAADGSVLAVSAAQGAAAEEYRSAAAAACQGRFFPFVEHGL